MVATADAIYFLWTQMRQFLSAERSGALIDASKITGLVMISKVLHENVAFGSADDTHTADIHSFAGFEDALEGEVVFHFHGPYMVVDNNGSGHQWAVSMDPTTFPTITFRKTSAQLGATLADLPVSTHYWSAWRVRRT